MQLFDTIPKTASTPQISFDPDRLKLYISGESYPENSFEFYAPIIQWVKEALAESAGLTLDINISYMNSSSTKCMLDLLDLLEEAHQNGAAVSIIWHFDKKNPRLLDLAEEFKEEVTLPFSIVEHSD